MRISRINEPHRRRTIRADCPDARLRQDVTARLRPAARHASRMAKAVEGENGSVWRAGYSMEPIGARRAVKVSRHVERLLIWRQRRCRMHAEATVRCRFKD